MKKLFSGRKTVTAILSFLLLTFAHAGTHLITFTPLTDNHISVPVNGFKIIKYQVTNHSKKTHTLMMQPITGISQITTAENCPNPFILGSKQSCILSLQIRGSSLQDPIVAGPKVCEQGNRLMCYQPSHDHSLNITQGMAEYTVSGTITGLTGTVTLLNNGANTTSLSTDGAFTFSTPIVEGSTYHVTVGTQPTRQTCTITNGSGTMSSSDVTNVTVTCVTNNTILTVSANGMIPVNSGSGTLTVTNTGGTYAAYNVHAVLPGGWTGVTQDASGCVTIAPHNGTCTLQFTSTTPYIAQGNITITGDNISSSPKTALAFTLNNYLVWSITGNTALVVASSDVSASPAWSMSTDNLNINETSTNPPNACNSATDGSCNSNQLVAWYGTPYTNYAAGLCYEITSDNTGSVSPGTWYLPAICQMGSTSTTCAARGLANIDTNLFMLGFGGFTSYAYWSSTEYGAASTNDAWVQFFKRSGSLQSRTYKVTTSYRYARCARSITF